MTVPLIDVTDVHFRYGERDVLNGITLIGSERRIGVVGRNGSGKSTLARVMAGLVAPNRGEVRIAGCQVLRDRKTAISTVGILFQNPDHQIIFPTVGEEIGFGLRQLGLGKSEALTQTRAMLAGFGREAWLDRPVSALSQGQRHLVCLMAVLAMQPKVIILDEPFAGLDIPTIRTLEGYLSRLDQTLVHITHDPTKLEGFERVIWIDGGVILRDGPPQEVLPVFLSAMERDDAGADL